MSDQLTTVYAEYLDGSYDCADRIVLNPYFGMGHTGGGMRAWWRRLHGHDDNLDKEHLMRFGSRLGRRVKAGERKQAVEPRLLPVGSIGSTHVRSSDRSE